MYSHSLLIEKHYICVPHNSLMSQIDINLSMILIGRLFAATLPLQTVKQTSMINNFLISFLLLMLLYQKRLQRY